MHNLQYVLLCIRSCGTSFRRYLLNAAQVGEFASSTCWVQASIALILLMLPAQSAQASDHADPIDPFNLQRQEGAITDLFVFPVRHFAEGEQPRDYRDVIANPYSRAAKLPLHDPQADVVRSELTPEQRSQVRSLVFVLCVRRHLTDASTLKLTPFEFKIHIDTDSDIRYPGDPDAKGDHDHPPQNDLYAHLAEEITVTEAFARYGGQVASPAAIREDITITLRLNDNAQFREAPSYSGPAAATWSNSTAIKTGTGVFDDPFIFPGFYGTNVVAMAVEVPIELIPNAGENLLIWATSHRGTFLGGSRQIDHVGRSLRTQNPRFEMLNTLHPSKHVDAIVREYDTPSLRRDLLLRANFGSLFAFRRWDFTPDVMCYSTRFKVGFPNGRLLTDDVSAILAQHGDTLLYELSYQNKATGWPRSAANDTNNGLFAAEFPYLNPPHPSPNPVVPLRLTARSIGILLGWAIVLLGLFVLENWFVARIYHRWKSRRFL